jgi:hypothetical protein
MDAIAPQIPLGEAVHVVLGVTPNLDVSIDTFTAPANAICAAKTIAVVTTHARERRTHFKQFISHLRKLPADQFKTRHKKQEVTRKLRDCQQCVQVQLEMDRLRARQQTIE